FPLHEHGRKAVRGRKSWVDGGPTAKRITEVGVEEGGMIDTISTADHCLAEPTEQFLRRIGKSDARAEVLVVGPGTRGVVAVDERPSVPTAPGVGRVGVKNGWGPWALWRRVCQVVGTAQI